MKLTGCYARKKKMRERGERNQRERRERNHKARKSHSPSSVHSDLDRFRNEDDYAGDNHDMRS